MTTIIGSRLRSSSPAMLRYILGLGVWALQAACSADAGDVESVGSDVQTSRAEFLAGRTYRRVTGINDASILARTSQHFDGVAQLVEFSLDPSGSTNEGKLKTETLHREARNFVSSSWEVGRYVISGNRITFTMDTSSDPNLSGRAVEIGLESADAGSTLKLDGVSFALLPVSDCATMCTEAAKRVAEGDHHRFIDSTWRGASYVCAGRGTSTDPTRVCDCTGRRQIVCVDSETCSMGYVDHRVVNPDATCIDDGIRGGNACTSQPACERPDLASGFPRARYDWQSL